MVPFIAEDLLFVLEAILNKFIRESVIEGATTDAKLVNVDVINKGNMLPPKKIDIEFAAKMIVQEAAAKNGSKLFTKFLSYKVSAFALLQKSSGQILFLLPHPSP